MQKKTSGKKGLKRKVNFVVFDIHLAYPNNKQLTIVVVILTAFFCHHIWSSDTITTEKKKSKTKKLLVLSQRLKMEKDEANGIKLLKLLRVHLWNKLIRREYKKKTERSEKKTDDIKNWLNSDTILINLKITIIHFQQLMFPLF